MENKRKHFDVPLEEVDEEYVTGGSYEVVRKIYDELNENHVIHCLPVEWTKDGIKFNYGNLEANKRPVIIMRQTDKDQLEEYRRVVLQLLLDYYNHRTYQRKFFLLLFADIYILLQDEFRYKTYYNAVCHLIYYCRQELIGAPCNPDCENYNDQNL